MQLVSDSEELNTSEYKQKQQLLICHWWKISFPAEMP
jgi:hypothetical protein